MTDKKIEIDLRYIMLSSEIMKALHFNYMDPNELDIDDLSFYMDGNDLEVHFGNGATIKLGDLDWHPTFSG